MITLLILVATLLIISVCTVSYIYQIKTDKRNKKHAP